MELFEQDRLFRQRRLRFANGPAQSPFRLLQFGRILRANQGFSQLVNLPVHCQLDGDGYCLIPAKLKSDSRGPGRFRAMRSKYRPFRANQRLVCLPGHIHLAWRWRRPGLLRSRRKITVKYAVDGIQQIRG